MRGLNGCGTVRCVMAGLVRHGTVRNGEVGRGLAGSARYGVVRHRLVRCGKAGIGLAGLECRDLARHCTHWRSKTRHWKGAMLPSSPEAIKICGMFHRRLTTAWTEREVRSFRSLLPIDSDDLGLLQRYYKILWPPDTGRNILRHDLETFLRHFPSELDRARQWCAKHPPKAKSKIIEVQFAEPAPVWTEAEEQKSAEQRRAWAELKLRLRG